MKHLIGHDSVLKIERAAPQNKVTMKKHKIQVFSEQSVSINGSSEMQINADILSTHGVSKTDLVTFHLTEEAACIEFSYEAYNLLKTLGYKNVDFTGCPQSHESVEKISA